MDAEGGMRARKIHLAPCLAVVGLIALSAQVAQAQVQTLTGSYNASGQALFKQFTAEPGNIVFSPYSIGTVMAMAQSGARGQTEAEMAKVLKQTLPRAAIERANGRMLATLNGYDKSAVPPICPKGMKLDGSMCKGRPQADGGCLDPMALEGEQYTGPATLAPSTQLSAANALML